LTVVVNNCLSTDLSKQMVCYR